MKTLLLILVLGQANPFDFTSNGGDAPVFESYVSVKADRDELRAKLAAYELNPMLQLHGLVNLKAEAIPVQWVITTSPSCGACHTFVRQLHEELDRFGWKIGEQPDAQFRIESISEAEWQRRGLTLPRAELFRDGQLCVASVGNQLSPASMSQDYILRMKERELLPKLPGSEQVAGMSIGTINAKSQVASILNNLTPFLDGGTLDVTYTPKQGVVKEWLTIKQGSAGIKLPAKTSVRLSITNGVMDIVPQGVKPIVIVGPLERSINAIEFSANKLSIRLPWMIDPEWDFK